MFRLVLVSEVLLVTRPMGHELDDQARWWHAYQLAENNQADELRRLAAAGDDHARRQLASWLSDRASSDRAAMEEAIEVIRPLADTGDDVARLWLARWLADCNLLDELRYRAVTGDYQALRELARRLAERNRPGELRELAMAANPERRLLILRAATEAYSPGMDVTRMCADLGDETARHGLIRCLASGGQLDELCERAESGDDYARKWLAVALRRRYDPHGR
jgi:hypothetical protein